MPVTPAAAPLVLLTRASSCGPAQVTAERGRQGRPEVTVAWHRRGSVPSGATATDPSRTAGATRVPPAAPWPWPWPTMRLAMAVPWIPKNWLPCFSPELVRSGPVITEPERSGWAGSTPVSSRATVTPEPLVVAHARVTCSLARHHSWLRTWSARAGTLPCAVHATARTMAAVAIAGRRNLSGTVLAFRPGTPAFCHLHDGYVPCADIRQGMVLPPSGKAAGQPGRGLRTGGPRTAGRARRAEGRAAG